MSTTVSIGVGWMRPYHFNAGDKLAVAAYHSEPGRGLRYPAMTVTALDSGATGGWDVYDGVDCETGTEVSFYGFSVLEVSP